MITHGKIRRALVAGAAAAALVACGTQSPDSGTAEGPVELTYWSWAPEIESIVAIWNEKNPDIQVDVSTAAGFSEFNAKLLAAFESGNPPDVANTNYQNLPLLVTSGVVADITSTIAPLRDEFSPVAWDMVDFDGQVFGVPQATTPNLYLYRHDRFAEFGIEPPTTWAEFADAARTVHAQDPDTYLFNFDPANFGFFSAMGQQAGVENWSLDNGTWSVAIDSPQAREVATFWGGLVGEGVVSTFKGGSPELNAAVARGSVLSIVDSVWAPVSMNGYAPDTAGLWDVVPAPQWDAAAPVSGVLGGSATTVSTLTEHPQEAAEFALWLNYGQDALQAYVKKVSIYPAKLSARTLPELQTPPPLVSNVPDFYQIAAEVDAYSRPVTWGPNVATASEAYGSALGAVVQSGASADGFAEALGTVQAKVVADLQQRGFDVAPGG